MAAPRAPPRRRPAPAAAGAGDSARVLLALAALYGALALLAYRVIHMRHVAPLGADAPPGDFAEGRVLRHLHRLAVDIPGRQEGSPGLEAAAQYINGELEGLAARAGPEYRIEVEETLVSGSFSMMFLRHRVTLGYRNHKNIVMRISSNVSEDGDPSLLVNGHFDSPLGSPGAADCGSCVASMLELSRLIIDSGWVPPRPVIFLFNGAEELFLLGSHGFIKAHAWNSSIGAFINIEASGSGGTDLVCQSGPGSWPSRVYAQSAKYPMANSVAQDMFGIIPGDTDYRIFAEDITNIPGLDIIFVLGGYFYHTSYDTLENLFPGSIQARGENLFHLVKAFTNSMSLKDNETSNKAAKDGIEDSRAVFFDYLTWFMVFYSRDVSLILHSLPITIFFLAPLFLKFPNITLMAWSISLLDLIRGMLLHAFGVILAIFIPAGAAALRLLFTKNAMNWFAHPYLAFLMFVPASLVGLLLPRSIWGLSEQTHFWGSFGLYSVITMAYTLAGLSGGFLTFFISMSMLLGRFISSIIKRQWNQQSPKQIMCRLLVVYVVPMIPCLLYCIYYGGFLIQFLIEKMGMMGSLPKPYGFFVPDIIVGAAVGLVVGWCFGPLAPIATRWLSQTSILQGLLQITVVALAISSQLFPYSTGAPKRVVLQHTYVTDANEVVDSNYGFSVVDANSLEFLFNNAPEAAKWLKDNSELSFEEKYRSDRSSWVALYPVPFLFSGSLKFQAQTDEIRKHYHNFPQLHVQKTWSNNGQRRVHLNLSLGSLSEIWTAVLNVTGPLSNWSFADNMLPAPQTVSGGPPSYICRLSGKSNVDWSFWLEANSSESLRIDVAVLDQYLVDSTKKLKSLFPSWADLTAFTTFFSTYYL
ncbi:endoplasmic reticulum metallopeptidase 1-like isoform X1 [Panicum virgatum]|uniref:endoplasmic reticulum metallopeptidase 1-like isoform X1 n=1 Tax=Panicum virgatum TaxID=38727 RepID=UPI0019D5174D|nr:endoplasmic reticulum metallopeptidase 1-like isoform X1 [Panicum virgatum]